MQSRDGEAVRMTGANAKLLTWMTCAGVGLVAATGCTSILGNGYEVETHGAGDGSAPHVDASNHEGGADAGHDAPGADVTKHPPEAGADGGTTGCGADAAPTTKAEFESNLCGGLACEPTSNAQLKTNPLCKGDGGATSCTLPKYTGTDAGAEAGMTPDAASPEGGTGSDAASAESGAHDAGSSTIPRCSTLPALAGGFTYPSTMIYAIGSTAIQPYVAHIAQILAAGTAGAGTAATIIYAPAGSCVGVQAAFAPAGSSPPAINALAATANYYDPNLDQNGNPIAYTCTLDSTAPADLGISDVFPSSCTGLPFTAPADPLPAPYYDFFGPVQVMEMLVPVSSLVTSISYQEAGLVWGYGGGGHVSPWSDDSLLLRRSAASGTQTMISLAIGLDPRVWQGVSEVSNTAVKTALLGIPAANASEALGILASDVADGIRESARPLAFQDLGQSCSWLPDSSIATFDKRNVRSGHYPIWGPSHFITTVNSSFVPKPTVAKLIAALNGTDPDVSKVFDVISLYANSHVIPSCAMEVSRTSDGQNYTPYQPPGTSACGCYYDDQVPLDTTTCTPCMTDTDCTHAPDGGTSCNIFGLPAKGFCERPGA